MRTTLLVPLLLVSVGWTVVSLLILRVIVEQQTRAELSSDLGHSVTTYANLQRDRGDMLRRESSLLADLPSLKALMTSGDQLTIADAGTEFWQISGSDLFALFSSDGSLAAAYRKGTPINPASLEQAVGTRFADMQTPFYVVLDGSLYEVAIQPIIFGGHANGTQLGYLAMGYALDDRVAQQVSQAAAAEVAFTYGSTLLAGTLKPDLERELQAAMPQLQSTANGTTLTLGSGRYLATEVPLTLNNAQTGRHPQLIVLKSFSQGQELLRRVNRWVATLGILALAVGLLILLSISRSITRPLASLIAGARAVGAGDYSVQLSDSGAEEVRELSRAFDRMRVELQQSQKELVQAERLATIGRMASSISHDLRHYLSAMYANAEFLTEPALPQPEREELLAEVRTAVHGMTELLDSLLLFTQTGRALHSEFESVALILQRAVAMLRSHPAARGVKVSIEGLSSLTAYVDSKKLGRAVYNLLLNGCEAARDSASPPTVTLTLAEDECFIRIHISDNGAGVPKSLERTMFLPFVTEGKASGIGLGLTLTEQIAAEHGGYIHYGRTAGNLTLFSIVLPKSTIQPQFSSPSADKVETAQ
jgi:signal transduction histidine kinase